jgi:hypothetical protein
MSEKNEWKPIASAPKDGTEIWAYNGEQARMRWTEGECYALWIWADDLVSDADPCPDQPTHWMPLPPAPTSHPIPTGATGEEQDDSIALDKLADYIADNWPDKKYGLEEICQRLHATWPGAFMPAAPAAGDALDSKRLEWIAQNAWALRNLENGRKNALVWQQPRTSTEGALDRLRAAIDAAIAQQKGEA